MIGPPSLEDCEWMIAAQRANKRRRAAFSTGTSIAQPVDDAKALLERSADFIGSIERAMQSLLGRTLSELSDGTLFLSNASDIQAYYAPNARHVVISEGLVQFLEWQIAADTLSLAVSELGDNSETLAAGASARQLIEHIKMKSLGAAILGQDLPPISDCFQGNIDRARRTTTLLALLFILLHEFGHIAFERRTGPSDYVLRSEFPASEALSPDKEEEFFADDFAIRAIHEPFRDRAISGAVYAFTIFGAMELIAEGRIDHPFAVNRIDNLFQNYTDADLVVRLVTKAGITTALRQMGYAAGVDLDVAARRSAILRRAENPKLDNLIEPFARAVCRRIEAEDMFEEFVVHPI